MRVFAILLVSLAVSPTLASAESLTFTFTGQTNDAATELFKADGTVIDLRQTAFTITGTVSGAVDEFWTPTFAGVAPFIATTTYDFGALGSITTRDELVELFSTDENGNGFLGGVGLYNWYPGINGFNGFLLQ